MESEITRKADQFIGIGSQAGHIIEHVIQLAGKAAGAIPQIVESGYLPWWLAGVALYLTPTFVAYVRRHRKRRAVLVANIICGVFSFVGWGAVFTWAMKGEAEVRHRSSQNIHVALGAEQETPAPEPGSEPGPNLPSAQRTAGPEDVYRAVGELMRHAETSNDLKALSEAQKMLLAQAPQEGRITAITARQHGASLAVTSLAETETLTMYAGDTRAVEHQQAIDAVARKLAGEGSVWVADVPDPKAANRTERQPVVVVGYDLEKGVLEVLRTTSQPTREGQPGWVEVDRYGWDTPQAIVEEEHRVGSSLKGRYDRTRFGRTFVNITGTITLPFGRVERRMGNLGDSDWQDVLRAWQLWGDPPGTGEPIAVDGLVIRVESWQHVFIDDPHNEAVAVKVEVRNPGNRPQTFDRGASTLSVKGDILYAADQAGRVNLNPGIVIDSEIWFHTPRNLDVAGAALTLRGRAGSTGVVVRPFD